MRRSYVAVVMGKRIIHLSVYEIDVYSVCCHIANTSLKFLGASVSQRTKQCIHITQTEFSKLLGEYVPLMIGGSTFKILGHSCAYERSSQDR